MKLEVLPKAVFNQRRLEAEFYEAYFAVVAHWALNIKQVLDMGYREATNFGLGAMDALHIAAAVTVGADEFVTSEKPSKSIHRTPSIPVISILDAIHRA